MAVPFAFDHYAPGSRGPVEVNDGGVWRAIPLIRNVGFTPTTPSETTTEFVDSPSQTRSGQSGPGTVTYDINRAPTLKAYRLCYDAFKAGSELTFRDWGGQPVVESGLTGRAAVAVTTGLVTLTVLTDAGTPTAPSIKWSPGRVLYFTSAVGDQVLTIESVVSNSSVQTSRLGEITTAASASSPAIVTPDDAAITAQTAEAFSISRPGTMREFTGRVTSLGGYTRGASNEGQVDQLVVNVLSFPEDNIVLAPAS